MFNNVIEWIYTSKWMDIYLIRKELSTLVVHIVVSPPHNWFKTWVGSTSVLSSVVPKGCKLKCFHVYFVVYLFSNWQHRILSCCKLHFPQTSVIIEEDIRTFLWYIVIPLNFLEYVFIFSLFTNALHRFQ